MPVHLFENPRRIRVRSRCLTILLAIWFLGPKPAQAYPPVTAPAASTPAGVTKSAPESVADLKQIEETVQSLVNRLTETTIGIQVGRAMGSGVIVTSDGVILTAGHVSGRPGREATIFFADGRREKAITLGWNRTRDAGMMKMVGDRNDWPYAPLAQASDISAGTWCVVTGHPNGYQDGRRPVVRLGRVVQASSTEMLQTDCTLVGGDSGGPVFDLSGRVIAINSRIGPPTSYNFHVPSQVFLDDWQLLSDSKVYDVRSGAVLGVDGESTSAGCRITKVHPGSAAEKAGLMAGDVITRLDERDVRSIQDLATLVGRRDPGKRVRIEVVRDGKVTEFQATLEDGSKKTIPVPENEQNDEGLDNED